MPLGTDPVAKLILCYGKLLLCIIILDSVPECVVHELADVNVWCQRQPHQKIVPHVHVQTYSQRYQPKSKGQIATHSSKTSMFQNGVCDLIIDQDEVLSRVLLPMMWTSSTLGDVLLVQYMNEGFDEFRMGIVRSGIGCCTLLADEGFELLPPLYLW